MRWLPLSDAEKVTLVEVLAKKPEKKSALENLQTIFAGRTATNWTRGRTSAATRTDLKARNSENGRKMFAAAACFACHRFANEGGMTGSGPEAKAAGRRYSPHDLLDQVINPASEGNQRTVFGGGRPDGRTEKCTPG